MPNSKDYMEMDDKYCAHNYHPIPVVISKAEGVWVYDPEGKKYLDCLSAIPLKIRGIVIQKL